MPFQEEADIPCNEAAQVPHAPFVRRKKRSNLSRPGRQMGAEPLSSRRDVRAQRREPVMDLLAFPEHVLACILESLPTEQLLNISRVSKHFADVCEVVLQSACRAHRWSLPRLPRGAAACTQFPWRTLYRQHACIACGLPGDFVLRLQIDSHSLYLICRRCTNKAWVQQRMIKENLFVDLVGVTGKKLLTQRDLGKRGPSRGAALLRDLVG